MVLEGTVRRIEQSRGRQGRAGEYAALKATLDERIRSLGVSPGQVRVAYLRAQPIPPLRNLAELYRRP